jgi:hypothetical protein
MTASFARVGVLLVLLILSLASLSFAEVLFPAQNVVGSTGLVRIPTADVLPYKNFNVGLNYGSNLITKKQKFDYNMNIGTFQGMELGITGGTIDNENKLREGVFINMKYSLATGSYDNPLFLAIGVENLSSYHQTDVYMVATRQFKEGPKLHFGFMGDFPGEKFRPLGMLGFDFPFWERYSGMFDMLAGETIFQFDLGVRYYLSSTLAITVSGLNITYNESVDEEDLKEAKDPKSILIGISWTNPL